MIPENLQNRPVYRFVWQKRGSWKKYKGPGLYEIYLLPDKEEIIIPKSLQRIIDLVQEYNNDYPKWKHGYEIEEVNNDMIKGCK